MRCTAVDEMYSTAVDEMYRHMYVGTVYVYCIRTNVYSICGVRVAIPPMVSE